MSDNGHTREDLLREYGRWYGDERFAVTFTAAISGDDAKRVTSRGWDQTMPLAGGDFAAGLIGERGLKRNIAIVLRPSNLIVIECDSEQDLERIEALGLPETIVVRSSEPYKRHYYFRPDPELETLPYVAFRFESGKITADTGRYFLAPPSIHPSGQIYSFLPGYEPDSGPIETLPAAVYRSLSEQARSETSAQRDALEHDPDAKIHAGNRRDLIFRYACMLRRWGLPESEILSAAYAFNERRCDPPVDRHLVHVQVEGAMKKAGGQELAEAPYDPAEDEPILDLPETDPWQPINLVTVTLTEPVHPTIGNCGLVYPGKRHVFSGAPESAKTLAAYAIALEEIRNRGHVLLIDFEMGPRDALSRLRDMGARDADLDRLLYLNPDVPATEAIIDALVKLTPTLVIIDAAAGAYDLQTLDDNRRGDVEAFTRLYVARFRRSEIATVIVDHVVKNAENRGRFAIGSERKLGGVDVHLGFETVATFRRGGRGIFRINTHKDREGRLPRPRAATFELASDSATHAISWEFTQAENTPPGETFRPTHIMEEVSRFLDLQSDSVTRSIVYSALPRKRDWVRQAIDVLVAEGYAEAFLEGQKQLVRKVSLYRESDDPSTTRGATVAGLDSQIPTHSQPVPGTGSYTDSRRSLPYGGAQGNRELVDSDFSSNPFPNETDDDIPF